MEDVASMTDVADPLDVYMGSLDTDILDMAQQGISSSTQMVNPLPFTNRDRDESGDVEMLSSGAAVMIANKVAASPFCDVMRDLAGDGSWRGCQRAAACAKAGAPSMERDNTEVEKACLRLLSTDPASFLRRFGHILNPADLNVFPTSSAPNVDIHLQRLKALMHRQSAHRTQGCSDVGHVLENEDPRVIHTSQRSGSVLGDNSKLGMKAGLVSCPAVGSQARNRRYRRLQQLVEAGEWGSDAAMRDRDPLLWYDLVGRHNGERKPVPGAQSEDFTVPGNGGNATVESYLIESLGFLSSTSSGGKGKENGKDNVDRPAGKQGLVGAAFLSAFGACSGGGDERVEEIQSTMDIDVDVTENDPTNAFKVQGGLPNGIEQIYTSGPTQAHGVVDRNDHDSSDSDDVDTAAVTEAMAGWELENRRVHWQEEGPLRSLGKRESQPQSMTGNGGVGVSVDMIAVPSAAGGDNSQQKHQQERTEVELCREGREEVARVMAERFLSGAEAGVDYTAVDGDERLDDLEQLSRDQEEKWFLGGQFEGNDHESWSAIEGRSSLSA